MIAVSKNQAREIATATGMRQTIRQTYRHFVQQQIVRQIMLSQKRRSSSWESGGWETRGIFTLFSAAAACGVLAQVHLG